VVTEEWLLEFAGQHAEYMEKSTSRVGISREFRSTTDLFQHVLQHPSVEKLIGAWQTKPIPTSVQDLKSIATPSKPLAPWSPGSTETPGSTVTPCSPDLAEDGEMSKESPSPSDIELDTGGSDVAADSSAAKDAYDKEEAKDSSERAVPQKPTPASYSSKASNPDSSLHHRSSLLVPPSGQEGELMRKFRQRANSASGVSRASYDASLPKRVGQDSELVRKLRQPAGRTSRAFGSVHTGQAPTPGEGGELMQKLRQRANSRSNVSRAPGPSSAAPSPGDGSELMQKLRQRADSSSRLPRASAPALEATLPGDDGELVQKLRQRTTTCFVSPTKRRSMAESQSDGVDDAEPQCKPVAENIAARRRMLEQKLSTCGFQKTASCGGA
jgi:hypothetical protein